MASIVADVGADNGLPGAPRVCKRGYGWSDASPPCSVAYVLPLVLKYLGQPPARVLDVGCGNGVITKEIAAAGFDVVGMDADEKGIAIARAAWPEVTFAVRDVAELSDVEQFDVIVSTEVIEHVVDPLFFARQCHRALRSTGRLILSTPYHGYAKNLLISLTNGWDRHLDPLTVGGHIKLWSRATLRKLLTEAGFEDVRFHGAGRAPFLWKSDVAVARKNA